MGIRQELTEYRVAIKRRYNITDDLKQKMIDRIGAIFDNPTSTEREVTAAAKVIIAAEQQNQTDEKVNNRHAAILEFAERLGVREDVESIASGSTGGNISRNAKR